MDNKQLLGIVEEALNLAPGSVREDDNLEGLEGWDSIGIISVMALIEDRCGVTLNPDELGKCRKVGDLLPLTHTSAS